MELAVPLAGRTVVAEATVAEDGSLHLEKPMLALKPGEKVMLTISPIPEAPEGNSNPLVGTVMRYDDPFGSAAPLEDWGALRQC